MRVLGFTLASTAVLSRVKPRARPAGTLYKSIRHRPIYGFNLMITLCCPVFSPFGECSFQSPPDKTSCYLIVKLLYGTKKNHTVSGYFFFFQVRRLRRQRQTKDHSIEVLQSCPDKPLSAKLVIQPGWIKPARIFVITLLNSTLVINCY